MTVLIKNPGSTRAALIGIQVPKRLTRIFVDYLTDAQLTRLSFWLVNQRESEISTLRLEQIQQEMERRTLQHPISWQELPFDGELQQAEWMLWAQRQESPPKKYAAAKTRGK
jgi:hypothetical protein